MAGAVVRPARIPVLYARMDGGRCRGRRRGVGDASGATSRLFKIVDSCAYYLNPFEWWAYSRDDHWPPIRQRRAALGWKQPVVQPFAARPATQCLTECVARRVRSAIATTSRLDQIDRPRGVGSGAGSIRERSDRSWSSSDDNAAVGSARRRCVGVATSAVASTTATLRVRSGDRRCARPPTARRATRGGDRPRRTAVAARRAASWPPTRRACANRPRLCAGIAAHTSPSSTMPS